MSDYIKRMRALGKFPAVLRFERMGPADLRKLIKHLDPKVREKLRHVDPSRVHLNTIPHGSVAALEDLFTQTEQMAKHNLDSQVMGFRNDHHPGLGRAARKAGPKRPWDGKAKPWRQAISTVHHEWFLADTDCPAKFVREQLGANGAMLQIDTRKEDRFEKAVVAWQDEEHGDAHIGSFSHRDEEGFHIHTVIAHTKENTTKGHPMGRFTWKPSEHRFFRNELDQKGRRSRTGYEVAQDAIGEFFARPEHADMNIVRGEPKAAKCRQAMKMADDLVKEADLEGFMGEAEKLPEGSKNAQAMWVLKNRAADLEAGRSQSGMKPNDERRELALEMLELIGALEPGRRNECSTRRAKKTLLAEFEETYGTPEQMLANSDGIIAKAAADAAIERARLDEAAERRRAEDDRRAAAERERLDREAEERLQAREAELAKREQAADDRDAKLDEKETALKKLARELGTWRDKLMGYAAGITKAARRVGLLRDPVVEAGLKDIAEVERMQRPRGFEIDD